MKRKEKKIDMLRSSLAVPFTSPHRSEFLERSREQGNCSRVIKKNSNFRTQTNILLR